MASPSAEVVQATSGTGRTVSPSAVASAKSAAVHAFGQTLHTVVKNSGAFRTENEQDAAHRSIDAFVFAHVDPSEMSALRTGNEHAAKEDVTLRVPPGGFAPAPAFAGLDYAALAKAILAEQQRQSREVESGE